MGRAYADSSERLADYRAQQGRGAEWYEEDSRAQFAAYWQQAAWEEAGRLAGEERSRLELELQAKLDLVAMDLETIESINRSTVRRLRGKVFFLFVLAFGVAAGSGYAYAKKLRPRIASLEAMIVAQGNEQGRLERELRDKVEGSKILQQKYDALAAELERIRGGKGASPTGTKTADVKAPAIAAAPVVAPPVVAPPVVAPPVVAPAATPQAMPKEASASDVKDVKAVSMSTPKSPPGGAARTTAAPQPKTAPAVFVRKVKAPACKCDPGDPMCGCIP
jgi:hypothetical protein